MTTENPATDVKESIGNALAAFESLKSEFMDVKGKMKSVEGIDKDKFESMADQIASGIEASQKAEARFAAIEEKNQRLEAALNRPSASTGGDGGKEMEKKANALYSEFLRTGGGDDYNKVNFDQFLSSKRLDAAENGMLRKALTVNSDPDGGFLVGSDFLGIMKTFAYETSPMRQLAKVISTSKNSVEYTLDNDEAEARWVSETAPRPETATPKLAQAEIPVNEIYAQPKASQTFIDDAEIDVEAWLAEKVADSFARKENTAFMVGTGLGQPRGILNYDAGTNQAAQQIEQVNSQNASAFTYDGLVELQSALKENYQANASFLVNRRGFGKLLLLKDLNGTPIFNMGYDKKAGLQRSILGAPLYFASDMPLVASNAVAAAYGDFKKAYLIIDRIGLRVLRDPFTDKPFVKFYTTKRVGGAVVNYEAVKLLKIAA